MRIFGKGNLERKMRSLPISCGRSVDEEIPIENEICGLSRRGGGRDDARLRIVMESNFSRTGDL